MPRKHGVKVPPGERYERRREVAEMIALRMSPGEITRKISEKYNLSTRIVAEDIRMAIDEMVKATQEPMEKRRARLLRALDRLYARCIADRDHKAAVAVLDRICRIEGLYAPDNVNVNHGGVVLVIDAMTTAAKRERIQELLGKAGLPELPEPARVN